MKRNAFSGAWLTLSVLSTFLFSCCAKDNARDSHPEEEAPLTIIRFNLAASRAITGDLADNNISSLRVLIYDSGSGDLKFNIPFEEIPTAGNTATLGIPAGTYDFAFIANEHSDDDLKEQLASTDDYDFDNIAKLGTLSFARSAFDAAKDIPMATLIQEVEVTRNNTVIVQGVSFTDVWSVTIERIAIRLRITFTIPEGQFEKWRAPQSISISGIPDRAYILPDNYNDGNRIVPGEAFAASAIVDTEPGFISEVDSDGNVIVTYDRLILPELMLMLSGISLEGLTVSMDFGDNIKSGQVYAPTEYGYGFSLPRNSFFDMRVTIKQDFLDVIGSILAWEDAPIGDKTLGDHDTQYTLTVDRAEYFFNAHGGTQSAGITTDYPGGWAIESDAISWDHTLPTVDDNNFTTPEYTTGTAPRTGIFTIRAGNLTKTIYITQFPPVSAIAQEAINNSDINAVWMAGQTGERLVDIPSGADNGDWVAIVAEGEEWIHLDTRASTATGDVDDPGFDESHIVAGNLKSVGGTVGTTSPGIYFRIGLNSYYTPTTDTPARYGIVLLSYANHTKMQLISIRQGEEIDGD